MQKIVSNNVIGFGSFPAFKQLVAEQMAAWIKPSLQLVDIVASHMKELGDDSLKSLQANNSQSFKEN